MSIAIYDTEVCRHRLSVAGSDETGFIQIGEESHD